MSYLRPGKTSMGKRFRNPGPERGKSDAPRPTGKRWTDNLNPFAKFRYINGVRIDAQNLKDAKEVARAHKHVVPMIDTAIQHLRDAKKAPHPLIKKYFGITGTNANDIKILNGIIGEYKKLRNEFGRITYEVNEEDSDFGENVIGHVKRLTSRTDGFVDGGIGDVQINWKQWKKMSIDRKASNLLHEAAHVILDKNVPPKFGSKAEKAKYKEKYTHDADYASLPTHEKLKHADTFSDFAMDAHFTKKKKTTPPKKKTSSPLNSGKKETSAKPKPKHNPKSKPHVITPTTSKDQCMSDVLHFDPTTGKKDCGGSCVKKKGHAGKHRCIAGHTW